MDLRQIMYFMCVYEEGSFTRAARKLGIVQPALSAQVARLEQEFGAELFTRMARGVVATAPGKKFYELCEPIRRGVAGARQHMLELARPGQVFGAVRCGFPPTFFKALLGPVLREFAERHPEVELTVREAYGGTLKEWVARGELDFALGAWFGDPGIESAMLCEEDLALVCGAPIAGERFRPCDLAEIPNLKLALPSANHVLGPILRQHISAGLVRPVRTMVMDSYLGLLGLARSSDWAGLVPMSGLLPEAADPKLWIYPVARPQLTFRWHLIHPQARALSSAAKLLVDAVAAELGAKQAQWKELRYSSYHHREYLKRERRAPRMSARRNKP